MDVVEVHLELLVDFLGVHCALVDLLQEIELGARVLQVVLASENEGDVMYDPLSVDPQELVAEGISNEILYLLPQIALIIKFVYLRHIYSRYRIMFDLPYLEVLLDGVHRALDDPNHNGD